MRTLRLYVDQSLTVGATTALDQEQQNYLRNVLRAKQGMQVVLFNGDGCEYTSTITELTRKSLILQVEEQAIVDRESTLRLHLFQAITKGDRMDFSVQKAVELGVSEITPVFTQHGVVSIKGERLDKKVMHWQKVAQSAAEQCGRTHVPRLHAPSEFRSALEAAQTHPCRIILSPYAAQGLSALTPEESSIALLIGPEGGLSEQEVEEAGQAGFQAVSFGPRILRSETATLAVITALQTRWGDLR